MLEVKEKVTEYQAIEQVMNAKQATLDDHGKIAEEAEVRFLNTKSQAPNVGQTGSSRQKNARKTGTHKRRTPLE
jgi:hypothetical protein